MATTIKKLFVAAVLTIVAVSAQAGITLDTDGKDTVSLEFQTSFGGSKPIQLAANTQQRDRRLAAIDATRPEDLWATTSTDGFSTFTNLGSCVSAVKAGRAEKYVPHDTSGRKLRPVEGQTSDRVAPSKSAYCFYQKVEHGKVWAYAPKGELFWFHSGEDAPYAFDACGNTIYAVAAVSFSKGGVAVVAQPSGAVADTSKNEEAHEGFQFFREDSSFWCRRGFWHAFTCVAGTAIAVGLYDDWRNQDDNSNAGVGGTFDPQNGGVGGTFDPQGSFNTTGSVNGSFDPQGSTATTTGNTGGVNGTFN